MFSTELETDELHNMHAKKSIKLSMTFQKTTQTDHDSKSLAARDEKRV